MENTGRLARLSKFVDQQIALVRNLISGACEYCPPSKYVQETPMRPCGGGLIAATPPAIDSSARLAPHRSRRFVFALISICIFGGSSPVMADDPSLQNLPPSDYSLLQSAVTSIKEATGLDDQVKSVLLSAVSQAANMAYSPYLQKFVLEKFALDSQLVFKGIVADPLSYAKDAAKGAGEDMFKGMAIDIAGAMAADAIFSVRPLADLPPKWEVPMHAMVHATVSELINLGASSVEPSEAVTGTAERVYDLYRIYKASVGLAHVQDEVVVQTAIGLEISARLVTLNPSAKNNELARSTISDAVDNLDQAFGTGYNQALTEIVNLTFVGLLSDLRGDKTRASAMVERIRAAGKLGVDDGLPAVLVNPVEWIAATVRLSDDPPSRTAALMISSTILADLNKADQVVAAPGTLEIAAATPQDRWGPDIVPQIDVGYVPCEGPRKTDDRCLRGLGLSDAAIAFSFEFDGDYSGMAVASSFKELGMVDLASAEVTGASSWNVPVLLNGPIGWNSIEGTRDLHATFQDGASRQLLAKYPNASSWAIVVRSHRLLSNGAQRFTLVEMITEDCHACPPIGSAVTFLDVGQATGDKIARRPVGLGAYPILPGMDFKTTPKILMQTPALAQFKLNEFGYDAGPMDGAPGPQTRQALMEFQVEHCLPPTGQLNDGTASALVSADGFAAPCADARLPPDISENTPPDRLVETTVLPDNAAQIRAYCASQSDAPGPGENGTKDPEILAAGGQTWRCMDGKVLVCYLGASGRGCLQTAAPTAQQMSELENFCRKNAGSNMIPARLMMGLATQWHCSGTNPTVESASSVDRLGYFTKAWHALGQSTAQETTAAVATRGAGLLGEYESTPEPSEMACTGIGHPLRIRPDGIDFYESVCTFAAPIPAGATEHASNVVCAGEGSTWSDRMFLKLLSDDLVSIASGRAPDGFVYRRCQGVADGSAQSEGPAPQAQAASAPELLATLAGRAFQGNARTKPKYANGPIARYDVQISVDDRGTATLRAGIASPPWSCTGNLTPTFVDGNRLTLEFGRTKGGDEIVIRCPNTGRISLMIGDPSGPQGFSWESLGEDNSSGSLAPLDAATFAEQQPPPDVDPCTESAWTGVIQMPIDLFICDQARAMMLFADGHDIAFNVPDSGLSLRDGWYYATFATRGTTIENTLKSMNVNGMKGWDEWFKVVNATIFYVTCAFNTADKPDLSPGARNVKAKLVQFSDGNLLFSCR